jgi:glyoxylase-like metal-dependent hydrolase (beta-lactamase superfamily II)
MSQTGNVSQRRWLKPILAGAGLLLLTVVAVVGHSMYDFRKGLKPLIDGVELTGGARTIKDGYSSAYLLPAGSKEVALIDCGLDTNGAAILAELSRRGLSPESVKAIFLTHAHPDHIAACHLFPHAEVYAFEADAAIAAGKARAHALMPWLIGTPKDHRIQVTRLLRDGESVTVGSLHVTPYLVTGHTAGSAVFLVDKTLFVGDSFSVQADGSLKLSPWVLSDSTQENLASLKQLATRLQKEHTEIRFMAPAHSGPVESMQPLLDIAKRVTS